MRVPTVRFGRDIRPIEPSEHKYWSVGAVAVMTVVIIWGSSGPLPSWPALTDSLARAILPRRVRERYWHPGRAETPRHAHPAAVPWPCGKSGLPADSSTGRLACRWAT